MCRLLGAIFTGTGSIEHHLLNSECSLFTQAFKGRQSDGWGIGFYPGENNPIVFKSDKPVYEDREEFEKTAKAARGRIIIAHVRKASNPRGLAREMLISVENSQPFNYSKYVFVHNGTINIPDEVSRRLGPYTKLIEGRNDSEVYFYLLLSLIEKEGDMTTAFRKVEQTLVEIFMEEKVSKFETPFTSLNTIFSDGSRLYAFTRYLYNPGSSICYGDVPVYEMCFKIDRNYIVVASEKTERGDWVPLKNNNLLVCWAEGGELRYNVLDFNV
ncbi:MAG: class II glutamine amidotransferase [Crenarchaeota archaeon]|nr:class II glutamine amidotransferase [Thermoproteota archaeon]